MTLWFLRPMFDGWGSVNICKSIECTYTVCIAKSMTRVDKMDVSK